MIKKLLTPFLLLCLFLLCTGCNGGYIFEKTVEIPEGNWRYDDRLDFEFTIEDTLQQYDLLLDITHAVDYGFQNIYVRFHTQYPSGEVKTQMVSLELARKSGIWNGECNNSRCTVKIPLQLNAVFKELGKHQITVEQYMRKNPLQGVSGMTLKIAESE